MRECFHPDLQVPGARLWRSSSRLAVIGNAVAFGFFGLLQLGMLVGAWTLIADPPASTKERVAFVLLFVAFLGFMSALSAMVWRDMIGKRSASIRLTDAAIECHLRRGRSLVHNPPACNETIARTDILAVETRLESYGALGILGNMQRAYRLVRRTGEPIFLFEERAIGTRYESASMEALADEIADWASAPLTDLGMVTGRGGALAPWIATPTPWTAASLSPPAQERQWLRVVFTASGIFLIIAVMWIVQVIASAR